MLRTKAKARAKRAEAFRVEQSQRDSNLRTRAMEKAALNEWQRFAEQSGRSGLPGSASRGFTMADEARNTDFRRVGWQSQGQLRKLPVNFVKSDLLPNPEQEHLNQKNTCISPRRDFALTEDKGHAVSGNRTRRAEPFGTFIKSSTSPPIIRKQSDGGEAQNRTAVSDEMQNLIVDGTRIDLISAIKASDECSDTDDDAQSQASSDSDDIVLYNGRGRQPKEVPEKKAKSTATEPIRGTYNFDQKQNPAQLPAPGLSPISSSISYKDIPILPPHTSSQTEPREPEAEIRPEVTRHTPRHQERITRREMKRKVEEYAILQDYIDNMSFRDGSDSEGKSEEIDRTSKLSEASWNSDHIKDFHDLSTSDEEPPKKVKRILSRRERESGLQYLVHANNQSVDDARWIHSSRLEHIGEQIRVFDAEYVRKISQAAGPESSDSISSETSEAINDLLDEIASEDDEIDAVQKRAATMTDEQIAQALARQESFGLPTNEVILFDGTMSENEGSDQDMDLADEDDYLFRLHKRYKDEKAPKNTRKSNRGDTFPLASAFANALDQDPYDAFDVMDFERPSLKKKSKGRRGKVDFEGLNDEELIGQLQLSWENDRQKKKIRKLERQELREQGKLGQNNGRIDMRAKYPHGMKHPQVKAEVKAFMLRPIQSMAFPPMQAHLRAHLHTLAAKVGVASKSRGSGSERFTILTKKKSTMPFDLLLEEDVDRQLSSKKPGKEKGTARPSAAAVPRRKGTGGVKSGAFYKDGEVVGAAAPEIGAENRGRAMLEKMGWISGTALGAFDNKGILQPVAHVVKNTKTGLG